MARLSPTVGEGEEEAPSRLIAAAERYYRVVYDGGAQSGAGAKAAASEWGGHMQVMRVNPSRAGTHERLCHDTGLGHFLIDFRHDADEALRTELEKPRPERFIGVIYRPESEVLSHYAEAVLPRQCDGWVWFGETTAFTPIGPAHVSAVIPDTFPFGLSEGPRRISRSSAWRLRGSTVRSEPGPGSG
jgi:hypothetical protein